LSLKNILLVFACPVIFFLMIKHKHNLCDKEPHGKKVPLIEVIFVAVSAAFAMVAIIILNLESSRMQESIDYLRDHYSAMDKIPHKIEDLPSRGGQ
jgi:hypothetical protein